MSYQIKILIYEGFSGLSFKKIKSNDLKKKKKAKNINRIKFAKQIKLLKMSGMTYFCLLLLIKLIIF